jgi:protein SCO1
MLTIALKRRNSQHVCRFVFVVLLLALAGCKSEPPLEVLGQVPMFSFTDQEGLTYGTANMRGHISVAAFMFTRCPTICPRITTTMKGLQQRAQHEGVPVHWLSFSVDPDNDTPAVLKQYAQRYQVDLEHWTFLSGDAREIRETAEQGFKIAAEGSAEPDSDHYGISHGSHLVLVDAAGQIRGYYRTLDDDAQTRLLRDVKRLATGS